MRLKHLPKPNCSMLLFDSSFANQQSYDLVELLQQS
jgi:hypothetical protein